MKKLLTLLLSIFVYLSLFTPIFSEQTKTYYWAISKDLETLHLGPNAYDNSNYADTGSFDADTSTTWYMPWSKIIEIDNIEYHTTNTVKHVVVESGMKPKSITRWFWEFEELLEVDLTNLDTSELVYMQETFSDCKKLRSINVSNFNTENVELYAACFHNLDALESLDLSSFYIKEDADFIETSGSFISNLPSLKELKLPYVIKEDFAGPGYLEWVDEDGKVVDLIKSSDAGKTIKKVNAFDLVVNNVLVSSENANDVLSDGKVSYDATSKTLTLNNVTLNELYKDEYNDDYALIYTLDSLNINLIGNNNLILPKVNDEYHDWISGVYFPSTLEDKQYTITFNGDNLKISGSDNDQMRGIMSYYSDLTFVNNANISVELDGYDSRGIHSQGDFNNNKSINVDVKGTGSWGIVVDSNNFINNGYAISHADKGAFTAKKITGSQFFLKGSLNKDANINEFEDVEFCDEGEYGNEYLLNNERIKAFCVSKVSMPTYSWNNDYSKCKAELNYDGTHKLIEEAESNYLKVSDASCLKNEIGCYQAIFTNPVFEKQRSNNFEILDTRHNDTLDKVLGLTPTVLTSGYKDAYKCRECNKYYEDENHRILIGDLDAYNTWKTSATAGLLDKEIHEIKNGNNQNFIFGSNGTLSFSSNGIFDGYFLGVKVDGELIDANNYDVRAGSIIVELNGDYLNTLSLGQHTLSILMQGVSEASTSFNIIELKPYIPPNTRIKY